MGLQLSIKGEHDPFSFDRGQGMSSGEKLQWQKVFDEQG